MKGTGLHNGVGFGPACIIKNALPTAYQEKTVSPKEDIARLEKARKEALSALNERISRAEGEEREILDAHAMMLADEQFFGDAQAAITENGCSAEAALLAVRDRYCAKLAALEDEYLAARAGDITDVVGRVLMKLTGEAEACLPTTPYVLVADDLLPSQTVSLDLSLVRGIVTAVGSSSSHAAILAKAYGIPTVVGVQDILNAVSPLCEMIVDADSGEVLCNPDEAHKQLYAARLAEKDKKADGEACDYCPYTCLQDGRTLPLFGNLGDPKELALLLKNGCEGIGLFRSELLFMHGQTPPTEDSQFLAYSEVAKRMQGRPVIIRTLDAGGDKQLDYLGIPPEKNPFLGLRAIRVCLQNKALFLTQLRAVLRAGYIGDVRMMFPMISRVSELLEAKALLEEAKASLRAEKTPFREDMPVGIMIEVPSAAIMSDALATEADFFSIGSNDLTQYTLAADRLNPNVSDIGDPLDPAVLRLIHRTVEAAAKSGIPVGVCGEMAGDPIAACVLSDMGVSELSMSAPLIPVTRRLLSRLDQTARTSRVSAVLQAVSASEVRRLYI